MPNGTYGGVRGRKTKVGRKLLRFPPTRLFVPLMESGSKYSILKEENFLSGHPLLLNISPGRTGLYLVPMSPSGYVQG